MRYAKKMILVPEDLFMSLKNVSKKLPENESIEKIARKTAEAQEIEFSKKDRNRISKNVLIENKPLIVKIKKDEEIEKPKIDEKIFKKELFEQPKKLKTPKKDIFTEPSTQIKSEKKHSPPNLKIEKKQSYYDSNDSLSDLENDNENVYFLIKRRNPAFLTAKDEIYKDDMKSVFRNSNLAKSLGYLDNPVGNAPPGTQIVRDYINQNNLQHKLNGKGIEAKFSFTPKLWPKI